MLPCQRSMTSISGPTQCAPVSITPNRSRGCRTNTPPSTTAVTKFWNDRCTVDSEYGSTLNSPSDRNPSNASAWFHAVEASTWPSPPMCRVTVQSASAHMAQNGSRLECAGDTPPTGNPAGSQIARIPRSISRRAVSMTSGTVSSAIGATGRIRSETPAKSTSQSW